MSDQRASSPSPARRSTSREKDPQITQGQKNALKGMQKRKKKSFLDKYSYHIVIGGFLVLCASALFSIFFSKTKKIHLTPVVDEDDISSHDVHTGYNLGPNTFFDGWMLSDAKLLFNNQFSFKSSLMRCASSEESTIIEDNYDFRQKYPQCVNPIRTQGNCSSSYAIASASALSDRICMHTGQNINLSPQTYLSCEKTSKGCEGGSVASFLDYAKKDGIVTEQCLPYTGEATPCPDSVADCTKYYVLDYCVSSTAETIKREILKNGPVIAVVPVYRDFLIYKDGVYNVQDGVSRFQGAHAIKILGWGKNTDGKEFWIAENSWGESWGDKGYAQIAIGQKNLYIDEFVMSPSPKVDKTDKDDATTTQGTTTTTTKDTNVETENLDAQK